MGAMFRLDHSRVSLTCGNHAAYGWRMENPQTHQQSTGVPDEAWAKLSRGSQALRAALCVSVLGAVGPLVFDLMNAASGSPSLFRGVIPYVFSVLLPLVVGLLSLFFSARITRWGIAAQSLVMAGLVLVVVAIMCVLLGVVDGVIRGPCEVGVYCSSMIESLAIGTVFFAVPSATATLVGYSYAQWCVTPRRVRLMFGIWVTVLSVSIAASAVVLAGVDYR